MAEFIEDTVEGVGDFIFGNEDEAQKKNEQNVAAALSAIGQGREAALPYFEDALRVYQEQFPEILAGITDIGRGAKNQAFEGFQGQLGGITQNLISTGRYSTSANEAARLQAFGQMQRTFADIDAGLASVFSNVGMAGLGNQAQLMQGLGDFLFRSHAAEADTRMGIQYQGSPGLLSPEGLQGIGSILGGMK